MRKLLKDGLLWHLFSLLSPWLDRGVAVLRRHFNQSLLYCSIMKRLKSEPASRRSNLCHLLDRVNGGLQACSYGRVLRGSLLYRLYSVLLKKFRESLLLGKLMQGGFSSVLLLCFAAYWPLDYLLREVLAVPVLSSSWDEILLFVSLLWVIHKRASADNPVQSRLCGADLTIGLYLVVGLVLLVLTSEHLSVNISGFRASMQYLLCFYLVLRLLRDEKDFNFVCNILIFSATVFSLHAIYQFIVATPIPEHWTDQAEQAVRTRAFSIFKNPNILAAYLVLLAPLSIGKAYASEKVSHKVLYWVCGLCMCLGCLFTMSRGAWIGLAIAAILFVLLVDCRLLLLLGLCGIAASLLPFVRSRITYLFSASFWRSSTNGGRIARWQSALGYVEDANAWVGGLGYGIYGGAIAMQNQINPSMNYMYVDNYYVKILAENGIAGLSAFIVSLLGLFYSGLKSIARTSRRKPVCIGLMCGMLGNLLQSFFESLWEEPYMMALFFVCGALMVFGGMADGKRKDNKA